MGTLQLCLGKAASVSQPVSHSPNNREGFSHELVTPRKSNRHDWWQIRSPPLFVLVDRGTASAAELFAAALQDNQRAIVVGSPDQSSFQWWHLETGKKGSIQTPQVLGNGGALLITTHFFESPDHRSIEVEGVRISCTLRSLRRRAALRGMPFIGGGVCVRFKRLLSQYGILKPSSLV